MSLSGGEQSLHTELFFCTWGPIWLQQTILYHHHLVIFRIQLSDMGPHHAKAFSCDSHHQHLILCLSYSIEYRSGLTCLAERCSSFLQDSCCHLFSLLLCHVPSNKAQLGSSHDLTEMPDQGRLILTSAVVQGCSC